MLLYTNTYILHVKVKMEREKIRQKVGGGTIKLLSLQDCNVDVNYIMQILY